jgi:SAM-dependent methyltransferase
MFDPKDMNAARGWVTGNCNGYDTEARWKEETPFIIQAISDKLIPGEKSGKILLDFGCGPGRIARGLLEANNGLKILCVDQSEDMRRLAIENLKEFEDRSEVLSVEEYTRTYDHAKFQFDGVYCVYVLQHVRLEDLDRIVDLVYNASDRLFLVNSVSRLAVTDQGFKDDGKNILSMIMDRYEKIRVGVARRFGCQERRPSRHVSGGRSQALCGVVFRTESS